MKMINLMKSKYEQLIMVLVSGLAAVVFLFKCELHPWIGAEANCDSAVFKTVALMMEKGYMPYRDSFDHKGPLTFMINWLANRISYYKGLWVMEVIFLAATFCVMYMIARKLCRPAASVIVTLTSLSLLFPYYCSNKTEEWAMLFVAIGYYIFVDYFLTGTVSRIRLMISGFCLGAVLMLRPNSIGLWMVFCIGIIIWDIKKKDLQTMWYTIRWFLIGFAIIVVPIVIWLVINNSFIDYIKDVFIFNTEYTKWRAMNGAKWKGVLHFSGTPVFLMSFVSLIYHTRKKPDALNVIYVINMIVNTILVALGGSWDSYGLVLIPAFVYPLAMAADSICDIEDIKVSGVIGLLASMYLFSAVIVPDWYELLKTVPDIYAERNDDHMGEAITAIVNIIKDRTAEDDAISVYGNWDIIYVLSHRRHATDYSYIISWSEERKSDYFGQLSEEQPSYVVVQMGQYDDRIRDFLDNNSYALIWDQAAECSWWDGSLADNGALLFEKRNRGQ